MIRAAIFASGAGTNAENILQFAKGHADRIAVAVVICNTPGAGVIARAEKHGVPCEVVPVEREGFASFREARFAQEEKVAALLRRYGVDWVLLAGYMQVIGPALLEPYAGRMVNIHPSLLPQFPGRDGYGDAWKAGVRESGVTVHFVDEGVDTGPVILQKTFPREEGDTFEDFRARGMRAEYAAYREFLEGLIKEAESFIKEASEDAVMDAGLIAEAQRVEHYEIAG